MMTHKCRACGCEGEGDAVAVAEAASLPAGWFLRSIDQVDYVLCDVCGHLRHFRGGLSPYLTDALKLDDSARCDVSADMAIIREKRRSCRDRRNGSE